MMPICLRCSAGPIPDNIRSCGLLKAPPETMLHRKLPPGTARRDVNASNPGVKTCTLVGREVNEPARLLTVSV